jgi:hypothetical protein
MSLWQVFRWPLAIGVLTLTGLIAGLVSDSWGDVLAAVGLFVPAAVCAWHGLRRRPGQQAAAEPGAEMNNNPT